MRGVRTAVFVAPQVGARLGRGKDVLGPLQRPVAGAEGRRLDAFLAAWSTGATTLLRRVDQRVDMGPEVRAVGLEALLATDQAHQRALGDVAGATGVFRHERN